MADYRKMLEDVGGYENSLMSVPAHGAQEIISDLEALQEQLKPMHVSEYHDDYGDCLFFHFFNMEEPPESCISSPNTCDFDDKYWTHFMRIKFNPVYEKYAADHMEGE